MHLFYTPDIETDKSLPKEEAAHAIRVLRLQKGDKLNLTDGKGYFYEAEIASATNKNAIVNILSKTKWEKYWKGNLHIGIAPTKNIDRIEWFAEKATEIGLDRISLLKCRYSERKVVKDERVEKILVSAMKQSLKALLPTLDPMEDFKKFIKQDFKGQKFIAHCYEEEKYQLKEIINKEEPCTILIGPEGDFSEEEVKLAMENGFKPISLGESRLRTETAALVAVMTYQL